MQVARLSQSYDGLFEDACVELRGRRDHDLLAVFGLFGLEVAAQAADRQTFARALRAPELAPCLDRLLTQFFGLGDPEDRRARARQR